MKFTELIKNLIKADSGYSSKRLSAMVLIMFSIIIPIICLFLKPLGSIDDSVLILSAQLLISGCSLLGFTLKEASFTRPTKVKSEIVGTLIKSLSGTESTEDTNEEPEVTERKKLKSRLLRGKEISEEIDNKSE